MHLTEETIPRPSESTVSSDSGVVVEDSVHIDNGLTKNINISTKISQDNNNINFNNNSNNNNINNSSFPHSNSYSDDNINDDFRRTKDNKSADSPSLSVRSHNISIVSLDDDMDSSVIDSDSDIENMQCNGSFIIKKLGQHSKDISNGNNSVVVLNERYNDDDNTPTTSNGIVPSTSSKPAIGSIAVQNSTDITFGNKTFYQGPVTIKQFLLDNNKWIPRDGANAADNPAFENSDGANLYHSDGEKQDDNPTLDGTLRRKKFVFDTKAAAILAVILLVIVVIGAITITALSLMKSKTELYKPGDGDDSRKNTPIKSSIGNDILNTGNILKLVERSEWIAQPPNEELDNQILPVDKVIIAHTATENCSTQAECTFRVRFIQTYHMESRGWDDIGYNFLVGGDSSIYVGRGWDKVGAHTKGYNWGSICIAFIGTFNKHIPPERQLNVAKLLIEEGVKLNKITEDYKLYGHRQLAAFESPGPALYKIIQGWPHWTNTTDVT